MDNNKCKKLLEIMKLNKEDVAIVEFMHDRLLEVYKENMNLDYMIKARSTVKKMQDMVRGKTTKL